MENFISRIHLFNKKNTFFGASYNFYTFSTAGDVILAYFYGIFLTIREGFQTAAYNLVLKTVPQPPTPSEYVVLKVKLSQTKFYYCIFTVNIAKADFLGLI